MVRRVLALAAVIALIPVVALRGAHPFLFARARNLAPARPAAAHLAAHPRAMSGAFAPPCASVLHLTADAFSIVYTAHLQDLSDLAVDEAAGYWARCRQQATTAEVAGNPALAARMGRLRTLLGAVQETETDLALLRAGGGTLFTHSLNRAATAREQTLADIAALAGNSLAAAPPAGYALTIDPTIQSINDRLRRVQHPGKADLQFTSRATWNKAARAYVNAVQAAEGAAGTGDTASRAVLLNFVNQPLFLDQAP